MVSLHHRQQGSRVLDTFTAGGLLLDLGVLSLRPGALDASLYPNPETGIPKLPPSHPAIIEWRAMTVIELYV